MSGPRREEEAQASLRVGRLGIIDLILYTGLAPGYGPAAGPPDTPRLDVPGADLLLDMTSPHAVLPRVRLLGQPHEATHLHWQVFHKAEETPAHLARAPKPDEALLDFGQRVAKLFSKPRGELLFAANIGREVWAFEVNKSGNKHSLRGIDVSAGISPIGPPKSLQLSNLYACPEHSSVSCQICPSPYLAANVVREPGSSSGVDNLLPTSPDGADVNSVWIHLASAVADRVAARERWSGRRMAEKRLGDPPRHRLTPTPDGRLLLCLASSSIATLPPTNPLQLTEGRQYRLWPILETAIFVRQIQLDPGVANRLYGDFADLVGRDWADGSAPEHVEWGGFLVPVSSAGDEIAEETTTDGGVVTWWPMCLVKDVPPAANSPPPPSQLPRNNAAPSNTYAADAAAFFEDCATQIAQEIEDEKISAMDVDASILREDKMQVQQVDLSLLGEPLHAANSTQQDTHMHDDSDSEDLFESTPTPPHRPSELPAVVDGNAVLDGLPVNKDSVDAVSSAVQSPAQAASTRPTSEYGGMAYYGSNAMSGGPGDVAMITDDDFNFFDEPEYEEDGSQIKHTIDNAMQLDDKDAIISGRLVDKQADTQINNGIDVPTLLDVRVDESKQAAVTDSPPKYETLALAPIPPSLATFAGADLEQSSGTAGEAVPLDGKTASPPQDPLWTQLSDVAVNAASHVRDGYLPEVAGAQPEILPVAGLIPAAFSPLELIATTRHFLLAGAADARKLQTQAELASRQYDPRQALKERLKSLRLAADAEFCHQYAEPKSTFSFEPVIDEDGSLDGISDSCPTDDAVSMVGSTDLSSVEVLDSAQTPGPLNQAEPAVSFDKAMSIKSWLTDALHQQRILVPLAAVDALEQTGHIPSEQQMHIDPAGHKYSEYERGCLASAMITSPGLRDPLWSRTWLSWAEDSAQAESAPRQEECALQALFAVAASTTGASTTEIAALSEPTYQVAHNGHLVQISAPALSHWTELGIQPISHTKRIFPVIVFDRTCATSSEVKSWYSKLTHAFVNQKLGVMPLSTSPSVICEADPNTFLDTVKNALGSAIDSGDDCVIIAVRYLEKSSAEALIRTHAGVLADQSTEPSHLAALAATVTLQLVDASVLRDATSPSRLAMAVYESAQQVVFHQAPRIFGGEGIEDLLGTVSAPAFTRMVPDTARQRPYFTLKWPPPSQDILDGHRILHVAYSFTPCMRGAVCFGIDSKGEMWDAAYLPGVDPQAGLKDIMAQVWNFALTLTRRAAIQWTVILTRAGGLPCLRELQAWDLLLNDFTEDTVDPLSVAFCAYDTNSGMEAQGRPAMNTDESVVPPLRQQIIIRDSLTEKLDIAILPVSSIIHLHYDEANAVHMLLTYSTASTTVQHSDSELLSTIVQDYHDLRDLGMRRWEIPRDCPFPAHIAMVSMLTTSMTS